MFHRLKYLFTFIFTCTSVNIFAGFSGVEIKNTLQSCFKVESVTTSNESDFWLAGLRLELTKSIGYCGCKSAITSYTVVVENEIKRQDEFVLRESREVSIILSSDVRLDSNEGLDIKVILACGS